MTNEKNKHYDDITEAVERLSPRGRALVADLVGRLSEGEGANGEGKTQSRLLWYR